MSNSSLADLKAITADHAEKFDAQGRAPVRGSNKRKILESTDPFDRPSPGLIKRLARQARNERFLENEGGLSDEARREIMLTKSRKYDAMKRGDLSGLSAKEIEEGVLDFDRWIDSDDIDESAVEARDPLEKVEYIDEMGRTRIGTWEEKRAAEKLKEPSPPALEETAYAEVLRSNVIHGDQRMFPVYRPDEAVIERKYKEAEESARQEHYDSTKEVRVKAAGHYQFSQDAALRAEQMASLKASRSATDEAHKEGCATSALGARNRRMEERRAMIDAKRNRIMGEEEVEKTRKAKREAETEKLLNALGS